MWSHMTCESSHDGQRVLSVDVFNVLLLVFLKLQRLTGRGGEEEVGRKNAVNFTDASSRRRDY